MPRFLPILALALSTGSVSAHPHVFVDTEGTFLFDDTNRLSGVRISWLYDPFTSLVLYDTLDLDKDRDGALDSGDLEKVTRAETDWDPEYEGDTYLWIEGTKRQLSRPANATAWMEDDRIGVAFDLLLETPQDMSGRSASLKLYDPIYYYAYSILGVTGAVGAEGACRAEVMALSLDDQTAEIQRQLQALSQEEIPDDPNIGALFAEEILLQCD